MNLNYVLMVVGGVVVGIGASFTGLGVDSHSVVQTQPVGRR